MMHNGNGLAQVLERKSGILSAVLHPRAAARQAMDTAAERLTRRNYGAAKAELLNEALARAAELCFELDESQALCNVDWRTGRCRVALPWGAAGFKQWGLMRSERDVLRFWLEEQPDCPWQYVASTSGWYCDLAEYPDRAAAMRWVLAHPVTPAAFLRISELQFRAR